MAITWTLDKVDRGAIVVSEHLTKELGVCIPAPAQRPPLRSLADPHHASPQIPPIGLVEALEHVYTPGEKDGTQTSLHAGHVVLTGNRSVYFPLSLLGKQRRVSLPIVIYNAFYGSSSYMCYVWSRLRHLRTVDPDVFGIIHRALFVVGEWFADISSNPPIVDLAMMVGRPDLRVIVSRFAYLLRVATGSLVGSDRFMADIFSPWHLARTDPFWKDVERALIGSVICVRVVQLASQNPPVVRCKPGVPHTRPDFFFDGNVGLVCCPRDKIVLVAVLLLSREIGLLKRATLDPLAFFSEHQVPKPLRNLITLLVDTTTKPVRPPPHHAGHYATLPVHGGGDPGSPEDA